MICPLAQGFATSEIRAVGFVARLFWIIVTPTPAPMTEMHLLLTEIPLVHADVPLEMFTVSPSVARDTHEATLG